MAGYIEKCEATDCVYIMKGGQCGADGIWVDSEGQCDSYETEEEGEEAKEE